MASTFKSMKFDFFVLNVRSFSKHVQDVYHDMYAQKSEHICLMETWIDPRDDENTDLNSLERPFKYASYGRGKGCAIFSNPTKVINYCKKVVKEQYQMFSIIDGGIQLILLYASKDCSFSEVIIDVEKMIRPDKKSIITGDFNFNSGEKNEFTFYAKKRDFVQVVSRPTHDGGRIIDHCYVPRNIEEKVTLTQYSPYYSDHYALCIKIDLD